MELVAPVRSDHPGFGLEFYTFPRALRPEQSGRLRLLIRDLGTGGLVRQYHLTHERVFHLFVISQSLEFFAHLHPDLGSDGVLKIDLRLPFAGVYHLFADFLPVGGAPQLLQQSLVTAGYTGTILPPVTGAGDVAEKILHDTRMVLTMPDAIAGREQLMTFELHDRASGSPAADLEPYLGAAGHLLLLSHDGQIAAHSHPVAELSTGPSTVVFQVLFPRAGLYRVWAQFQRNGTVLTAPFTIPVREPE